MCVEESYIFDVISNYNSRISLSVILNFARNLL